MMLKLLPWIRKLQDIFNANIMGGNNEYKENDLFRPSDNWRMNACIGKNGGPYDYSDYSRGYFDAGKRLIKSAHEDPFFLDVLVYPLVFLCRHGIELGLKHLSKTLPKLLNEPGDIKFTHRLQDNWVAVSELLKKMPEELNNEETLTFVYNVIKNFCQFDPNGETFRFPEDKKGSLFLQDSCIINVAVFGEIAIDVSSIFEYWFDEINILAHYNAEMLEYVMDY